VSAPLTREFAGRSELSQSKSIRAAALCYDTRLRETVAKNAPTEAIAVSLEHENGESIDVYLPYRRRERAAPEYETLVAVPRQRQFFAGLKS